MCVCLFVCEFVCAFVCVKNNTWRYVNGKTAKPKVKVEYAASTASAAKWEEEDLKAQSDLVLAISSSENKQIKVCKTSHEIWLKLEEMYQSKGPMRKTALLNQLLSKKMEDGGNAREYTRDFFNIADKFSEMDIAINQDLLSVILLRSLPERYENVCCAIPSSDVLPSPENLRIKITEEFDAQKVVSRESTSRVQCQSTNIKIAKIVRKARNTHRRNYRHKQP